MECPITNDLFNHELSAYGRILVLESNDKRTMAMLLFLIFATLLTAQSDEAEVFPVWKVQLAHFDLWKGSIDYAGINTPCMMLVHSIKSRPYDEVMVTFTADNIQLDMVGQSGDNINVTFEEYYSWEKNAQFEDQTDFIFTGKFHISDLTYYFEGTISTFENPTFGTIWLSPAGHPLEIVRENSSLRYGLAIGIPVTLAVLLMITAALIMWWACKKGYLRHVPLAYQHFTNPKPNFTIPKHTKSTEVLQSLFFNNLLIEQIYSLMLFAANISSQLIFIDLQVPYLKKSLLKYNNNTC
ncbi:hypothetical protein Btru_078035 [Bulinus truncatus]|nr:hypothetical protein Btru_078035 [Bulinus truncatus]